MRIIGQQSIADLFGVSRETIDNWQQIGFPVAFRGGPGVSSEYESAECIGWRVTRAMKSVQEETPNDRLARVKADAIEMDNAERRGQLIPADLLEPKMRAAMVAAREAWLNEPQRLARMAHEVPADELEALLEQAFSEFLTRMSRWRDADPADEIEEAD